MIPDVFGVIQTYIRSLAGQVFCRVVALEIWIRFLLGMENDTGQGLVDMIG
jgi:hypothetical protein